MIFKTSLYGKSQQGFLFHFLKRGGIVPLLRGGGTKGVGTVILREGIAHMVNAHSKL